MACTAVRHKSCGLGAPEREGADTRVGGTFSRLSGCTVGTARWPVASPSKATGHGPGPTDPQMWCSRRTPRVSRAPSLTVVVLAGAQPGMNLEPVCGTERDWRGRLS